jgi:hypothetical protein
VELICNAFTRMTRFTVKQTIEGSSMNGKGFEHEYRVVMLHH